MEQGDRFWQLVHYLVTKKDYMIVNIQEGNKEIWLQNFSSGKYPFIYLEKEVEVGETSSKERLEAVAQAADNMLRSISSPYSKVLYLRFPSEIQDGGSSMEYSNGKMDVFFFRGDSDTFVPETPSLFRGWLRQYEVSRSVPEYVEEINSVIHDREKEIRKLQYRKSSFFVYFLMGINIALFLLLEIAGAGTGGSENPYNLIRFGAKYGPYIATGQIWRLFTYMFLHIGIYHLATNMLSLYFIGPLVDQLYGKWAFLFIYILSGISGGVLSFALSANVSAGASGAIFGLMGSLLYIGILNRDMFRRTIGKGILVVVAINLFYGFSISGIDNLGHLGGLLGGFLAAGIIGLPGYRKIGQKIVCTVGFLAFLLFFFALGLNQYKPLFS